MVSEQPARKVVQMLKKAGFIADRSVGSHTVWVNGSVVVSVPDGHRTISPGVVRQVTNAIKEAQQ
jgi:predicted RNA binding protein YcfA (HicA-like mRNA interferase family)